MKDIARLLSKKSNQFTYLSTGYKGPFPDTFANTGYYQTFWFGQIQGARSNYYPLVLIQVTMMIFLYLLCASFLVDTQLISSVNSVFVVSFLFSLQSCLVSLQVLLTICRVIFSVFYSLMFVFEFFLCCLCGTEFKFFSYNPIISILWFLGFMFCLGRPFPSEVIKILPTFSSNILIMVSF